MNVSCLLEACHRRVVGRKQESGRSAHRKRDLATDRDVPSHLWLRLEIDRKEIPGAAKVGRNGESGDLKVVPDEKALVGVEGIIAKIHVRHQIDVGNGDLIEPFGQGPAVCERKAGLEVVKNVRAQRAEKSDQARRQNLESRYPRTVGPGTLIGEEHRIEVESSPDGPSGARLDESRLVELRIGASLGEVPVPKLEVVETRRVKNYARSHVNREAPEASQKVPVLPTGENVPVGLDREANQPPSRTERSSVGTTRTLTGTTGD